MKKILYVLLGLIAVYLILCLIGPSSVRVERSISIHAQADVIKSKIVDLKFFHETWSPWTEKDPQMKGSSTCSSSSGDIVKPPGPSTPTIKPQSIPTETHRGLQATINTRT